LEIINSNLIDPHNPLMSATDMLTDALDRRDYEGSLANCHAPGLDSIVLKNNSVVNGGMARIFLAHEETHPLGQIIDEESGNFVIGVHDHRFPLTIVPLLGSFVNYEVTADPEGSEQLHEYAFSSGINGTMGVSYQRQVTVRPPHFNEQEPGGLIRMTANDLHTVIIPNRNTVNKWTAWLVLEEPTEKTSHIYSPTDHLSLNSEGLYQPLDPALAKDAIERILIEIS